MTTTVEPAYVLLTLHAVPTRVQHALIRHARKQHVSVNEAAAAILAHHYQISRIPPRSRYSDSKPVERMMIRVDPETRQKLRETAASNGATIRGTVIQILAAALGLPAQNPGRRARKL